MNLEVCPACDAKMPCERKKFRVSWFHQDKEVFYEYTLHKPFTIEFERLKDFEKAMANFPKFVKRMEDKHLLHIIGFFKLKPPDDFEPVIGGLDFDKFKGMDFVVENPYYQKTKEVSRGVFHFDAETAKRLKKPRDFYAFGVKEKGYPRPKSKTPVEIQEEFMKNLPCAKPLYGTEIVQSIMNSESFNYSMLKTILTDPEILDEEHPGVTTPYIYWGEWMAYFGLHVEDKWLYAINTIIYGEPKDWFIVRPLDCHKLEEKVKDEILPQLKRIGISCSNILRHKSLFISPHKLNEFSVGFRQVKQKAGEMIIVFPGAYHQGYNQGPNVAESINFGSPRWIEYGKRAEECNCFPEVFKMDKFISKYQGEDELELWKKGENRTPHPEWDGNKKARFLQDVVNKVVAENSKLKKEKGEAWERFLQKEKVVFRKFLEEKTKGAALENIVEACEEDKGGSSEDKDSNENSSEESAQGKEDKGGEVFESLERARTSSSQESQEADAEFSEDESSNENEESPHEKANKSSGSQNRGRKRTSSKETMVVREKKRPRHDPGKKINCQGCTKMFWHPESLRRHMRDKHPDSDFLSSFKFLEEWKQNCPYCKESFSELRKHVQFCSKNPKRIPREKKKKKKTKGVKIPVDERGKRAKQCKCPLCPQAYCDARSLKRHIAQKHAEKKDREDVINATKSREEWKQQCPYCATRVVELRHHNCLDTSSDSDDFSSDSEDSSSEHE